MQNRQNKQIMRKIVVPSLLLATVYTLHALPALAQPDLGLRYGEKVGLGQKSLTLVAADIINWLLGLLGIAAIVIILYAGFLWMTSAGNDENIKKAKGMLSAGVVGLVIILAAYSIARFVVGALIKAAT